MLFAAGMLVLDTWPSPPSSLFEWMLLALTIVPVIVIGEWLGKGVLQRALTAVVENAAQGVRRSWLRVSIFVAMCILFATTAVAIFEWVRLDG